MLTGKQRSKLKSMAHGINPSIQIGKEGLSDEILQELDRQLEYKELIKISVLENSPVFLDEIRDEILQETSSEFVQEIGSKLVIYRQSKDHKQIDL